MGHLIAMDMTGLVVHAVTLLAGATAALVGLAGVVDGLLSLSRNRAHRNGGRLRRTDASQSDTAHAMPSAPIDAIAEQAKWILAR